MSEWWTYSLSDFLMFSARTWFRLLELYNRAVWPAHLAAAAAGIAIVVCALRCGERAGRGAAALLGLSWLWVAWAFHAQRYATISSAGNYFAAGFALQGLLLFWVATSRDRLRLGPVRTSTGRVGIGLLLFALLAYPLLAPLSGRSWLQAEVFAIAPDPTAAATLAVLSLSTRSAWLLWPIPLAWCGISAATLWTMHQPLSWLLPLVAVLALLAGRYRYAHQLD
jgi:hypothetical protein